jgi:hypothetical protein
MVYSWMYHGTERGAERQLTSSDDFLILEVILFLI